MNKSVDTESFKDFIKTTKLPITVLAKEIGISASHLHGMLKGKIKMGEKTQRKIKPLLEKWGLNLDDILKPSPMMIDGKAVEMIVISEKETNNLVAAITSKNVLLADEYEIESVPPIY